MADNIIDFKSKDKENLIKFFPEELDNDPYLKLSCFNALDKAGYEVSPDGVRVFQHDVNINPTGVVDIETLSLLIQVFDNDKIQDILSHMNRINSKSKKKKRKATKEQVIVCIWLAIICFFIIYGFFSLFHNIISLIR